MQLLNDHVIVSPRTIAVGEDTDSEISDIKELLDKTDAKYFRFNYLLPESTELTNFSQMSGYDQFWNLAKVYSLTYQDGRIFIGYYVGTVEYQLGLLESNDCARIWGKLSELCNQANGTIASFIDIKNQKFIMLNEENAVQAVFPKIPRDEYLKSKLRTNYQVFQFYDNQPVNKLDSTATTKVIPIFNDLANLFYDPSKAAFIDSYVKRNAITYLHSDFDPSGQLLTSYSANTSSSPVIGNAHQMLFRMVPAFRERPGFKMMFNDSATQFMNIINSPEAYTLKDIKFDVINNGNATLISLHNMFEGVPFDFAYTKHNILPYIASDNITCLYWPNIKIINNIDGTSGLSFNDYIYFFDMTKTEPIY